jgi:hypothetical protein
VQKKESHILGILYVKLFCGATAPLWPRFLDHTQLDTSARQDSSERAVSSPHCLNNTNKPTPSAGFEPSIPTIQRPQTYTLYSTIGLTLITEQYFTLNKEYYRNFQEAGLLGACDMWWGQSAPKASTKRYEPLHGIITLKMKAVPSFETSGRNYPTTWRNNPEDVLTQYRNRVCS